MSSIQDAAMRADHRTLRLLFSANILVSAFLLFAVQPMFAKMALPELGGSPAVWSVSMVFFQAALLAGYAWAHVATRMLPQRIAMAAHLTIMALALLFLPIGLAPGAGDPPAESQALWLFGLLLASIGLPFAPLIKSMPVVLALNLGVVFLASLVCHGRVYALRPPADRLTEFYLYVSLGGVLGGAFCGLLAPAIFPTVIEYPLLIAAALFCAPALTRDAGALRDHAAMLGAVAAGGVAVQAFAMLWPDLLNPWSSGLGFIAVSALLITRSRFVLTAIAGVLLVAIPLIASYTPGTIFARSFFGVHRLINDGGFLKLVHGTTIHGAMRLADASGDRPVGRPEPLTYYTFGGAMGDAIAAARAVAGRPLEVGVVGLGAGSLACHAREGDTWRFYEIDAEVVKLARNPALFRFLAACLPDAPVVVGDARLTVPRGGGDYDVLVIDAFSSDAIPIHLLTVDALRDFQGRLHPRGVAVFHISNRHLDLRHVLARGFSRLEPDMTRRPWTDDHANILEAIIDKWRSGP